CDVLSRESWHYISACEQADNVFVVEPEPGIHVTEDGTVDVGGHAGFITEGEGVGAAFSFEGYSGDFYVCADGLLGISGVYEAADFNFTSAENSGTFEHN